jgi:hypothetical protein
MIVTRAHFQDLPYSNFYTLVSDNSKVLQHVFFVPETEKTAAKQEERSLSALAGNKQLPSTICKNL